PESFFSGRCRQRAPGAGPTAHAVGLATGPAGPVARADAIGISARAWFDLPTYAFFQRISLTLELSTAANHHLRIKREREEPAVSIEIDPIAGVEVGPVRWSGPQRVSGAAGPRLAAGDVVRATVPLTFTAAPGSGDHVVGVTVRYDLCRDGSQLEPSSMRLEVPISEAPLVGRSLPSPTATR